MDDETRKVIEQLRFNLNEYISMVEEIDNISLNMFDVPIVVLTGHYSETQVNAMAALDASAKLLEKHKL